MHWHAGYWVLNKVMPPGSPPSRKAYAVGWHSCIAFHDSMIPYSMHRALVGLYRSVAWFLIRAPHKIEGRVQPNGSHFTGLAYRTSFLWLVLGLFIGRPFSSTLAFVVQYSTTVHSIFVVGDFFKITIQLY